VVVVPEGGMYKPPKNGEKKNDKKKKKKDDENDKNNNNKNDDDNNKDDEVSIRSDRAMVVVHLPRDAKLYVDSVFCPLTSDKRSFQTPRLEPGRRYYYTLKVEVVRKGKPVKESRKVYVTAGKKVSVDFGEMTTVSTVKKR
jgi:uncharacterized protein (TIGR03000 family)